MTTPATTTHAANSPRAAPGNFTTHTFTTPRGATLAARVWAADPAPSTPAPFVVWTHGGGFLAGNHYMPLAWMEPGMRQRGWHLVSHSYRLGPQTSLDESVEDCIEAVQWLRANLPGIVGQDKVDVDRYVLCGESAGGTMVTMMGHSDKLQPPPRAIINAYGAVDLSAIMQAGSSSPVEEISWDGHGHEFTAAELQAFLADRDPAKQLTEALCWDEKEKCTVEQMRETWRAPEFEYSPRIRLQAELHMWRSLRRNPMDMVTAVFHAERFGGDKAKVIECVRSVSAVPLLDQKTTYPPTAFLHGTGDKDVSIEQSKSMARKLAHMGVSIVECYEEGEPHVFDNKYTVSLPCPILSPWVMEPSALFFFFFFFFFFFWVLCETLA
jgi:acetyl esterase/lipase